MIYEYGCRGCNARIEKQMPCSQVREPQYCEDCGEQLDLEPSLPAKRAVGFAGKAGGRTDGINR